MLGYKIRNIYDEQFDISYYIKGISWSDTENMAIFERKEIYNRLLKRKSEERNATEEEIQKATQTRENLSRYKRMPKRR